MKFKKILGSLLLTTAALLWLTEAKTQNWNPSHAISTSTGNTHFSYAQTPAQLIELYPAAFPNTGLTYQWESGTSPLSFSAISGATGSSYSFSSPLTQTTYFRRKAISGGQSVYSNTIKIRIVSTGWEDRNYVREHGVRISGQTTWQGVDALSIGDKLQTTSYMDGLGRNVQQVSKETATPSQPNGQWGDMVQFSAYDNLGREPIKYLPYTTTTESGKFKTAPVTEQTQYYSSVYSETSAFSQITFDNSPLSRVKNIKAPGSAWAASAGNSAGYELNEIYDDVQIFYVSYTQGSLPVHEGVYPANSLYKSVSTDENGKKVIEYSDKEGKLILRKVQLEDNPSGPYTGWICTYSIYDDFGQLRFQLQPEAVKYLEQNAWSFAGTDGQKVLDELCFQYFYDEKGRNIWKKAPGAELLQMIYDGRDRVVFMQDGNQRAKTIPEWTANLYDELDRPVITTLYATGKSVANLETDIANAANTTLTTTDPGIAINDLVVNIREQSVTEYKARNTIEFLSDFESESTAEFIAEIDPNASTQATIVTVNTHKNPIADADLNNPSLCTILKYQFYDSYSFPNQKSFASDFQNALAYSSNTPDVQIIATTKRTIGYPTGSRVRVLGTNTFLNTTSYFDERGAQVQAIRDNYPSGNDILTVQYHFDGRVLSTHTKHSAPAAGFGGFSVITKNIFDNIGRVTGIEKKWGTNSFKSISEYSYDDVGRLKTKRLDPGYTGADKNELEALTYSYNLHNLITGINKDYALKTPGSYSKWGHFFGLYLGYDNSDGAFSNAKLNGQVTGLLWNTQGDDAQRKYDYTYDNAGRLINAVFNERQTTSAAWSNARMDFSVSGAGGKIGYDLNGNLLSMVQKGVTAGSNAPVVIDDLQYSYASLGNKLMKVTDLSLLGANNGKAGDFKDGTNGTTDDYVYDANGNLVIDLNKGAKELANVNGANGIRYNFLDKPEEIRIAGKGTIKIVYDAEGAKLQRTFVPEGTTDATTTSYINSYVYQESVTNGQTSGLKLQYISFEEGRIRQVQPVNENNGYDFITIAGNLTLPGGMQGAVDYYIRDYQQNVRMILTEETHIGSNQATMETARASGEEALFGQAGSGNEVEATRFAVANIPGQTIGQGWDNPDIQSQVSRLGNLAAKKVGPNALLKVMAGDEVSSIADYYYKDPVTNGTGNNLLTSVLGSLINAISGSPVASADAKDATTNINNNLNTSQPFSDAVAPDANNSNGNIPKAYLNILFFNERFEFVEDGSTAVRVQGSGNGQSPLQLLNIKAPKNGYCFVYLSNESDEHVYFDNFKVTHNRRHILEENHYYAYGLKIAAISSKKVGDAREGHLDNKYLYQGAFSEMDDDIGWNDFELRNYDLQLGRWVQQDPYQQYASPYVGMGGDPVNLVDPNGGETLPFLAVNWSSVLGGANSVASTASTVANIAKTGGKLLSIASLTASVLNVVNTTCTLINTDVTTSGVGLSGQVGRNLNGTSIPAHGPNEKTSGTGKDDYIRVNSRTGTVAITPTDDPYDILHIDDNPRMIKEKGWSEQYYKERGWKFIDPPEGVGMGAVDGAIVTLLGVKVFKWAFGRIAGWFGGTAAKGGSKLAIRTDIVLSGGRSGQLVKTLTGPANSVVKGGQGRIFITDDAGKVIWDVTKDRAKSVIPGQGFGPKVAPTQEQLNLLKQVWGN